MKLLLPTFLNISQSEWIINIEAFAEDSLTTLDGWIIQNQFQVTSVGGLKTFE
ncbi:unnamed protein product [Paramecium octaurelia]|uniref:Uncharacterized protein n=1 Tax=Paramecium octaurelia TaxID=43137 RepID=A0A8S1VXW9_PAROT|nr:unnamed protein product [Paramecium octaurelia]